MNFKEYINWVNEWPNRLNEVMGTINWREQFRLDQEGLNQNQRRYLGRDYNKKYDNGKK